VKLLPRKGITLDDLESSVLPKADELLVTLVVGLEAQREREASALGGGRASSYPLPDTLRVAWNALAYHGRTRMMTVAPVTLSGLLKCCRRPVGEWLPSAVIPADFSPNAPLLYRGPAIELSEAANELLDNALFVGANSGELRLSDARSLVRFLENRQFVELFRRLRTLPWTPAIQAEYVRLRRFLIEHPCTTRECISHHFEDASVLSPATVGALYADCRPDETVFQCDHCGLLRTVDGSVERLVGAKPNLCNDHAVEAPHVRRVPYERGLCRVSSSVNARVTLHGIAEVALFDRLHALRREKQSVIRSIEEWPGVDNYDLRVVFDDGVVWAADVKEFADPNQLAAELKPFVGSGFEHTRFDRAFYVVPQRRIGVNPSYLTDALFSAGGLHTGHDLYDDEMFVALVASYTSKKERA
jgi:hypothetical protein